MTLARTNVLSVTPQAGRPDSQNHHKTGNDYKDMILFENKGANDPPAIINALGVDVGVRQSQNGRATSITKTWQKLERSYLENPEIPLGIPNDIKLAGALCALSPSVQKTRDISSEHGVDLF
ncbi:hypothetical protein K435DRAFT_797373 [Dendrothele bispora CBS 962.96]|uniref:Uncharacterized protein n=1 Tax=Dendrothele bispora (strain CBS 962.96) TaxID=1314807 RepID=A0A4S8M344_DENBC|nr:hypothetical protein K435DRAFT_797373 [Dendrothele bispora CBS 962.96]